MSDIRDIIRERVLVLDGDVYKRQQKHCTYIILFEIHHNGHDSVIKLQKFSGLRIEKSIDPYDSITHLQNFSYLLKMKVGTDFLKLTQKDFRNFRRSYSIHHIK